MTNISIFSAVISVHVMIVMFLKSEPMVVLDAPGIILDIVSKTVLQAYTNCIEGASDLVQFNIHAKGNVVINNCNVDASTSDGSFPPGCNIKPINATLESIGAADKLRKLLDDAIIAENASKADKTNFISKVVDSVTNVSSETCAAVALNSMVFDATAGGNVTIDGCNITQTASANIFRCVHNTLVPSEDGKTQMPLNLYVQNEIQNSGNYKGVQDPTSGAVQPAVPPCPNPTIAHYAAMLGFTLVFIVMLSFILVPILMVVRHYRLKAQSSQ